MKLVWKLALVGIIAAIIGVSLLAVNQGKSDYNAKQLVAKIEEARKERVRQINYVNHTQCKALQNLYDTIRLTITQSDAAIDTIQYYREHPDERARAHQNNQDTLNKFIVPPCPKNINIGG